MIIMIIITNFLPHGVGAGAADTQLYSSDDEESVPCIPIHALSTLAAFIVCNSTLVPELLVFVSILHDGELAQF